MLWKKVTNSKKGYKAEKKVKKSDKLVEKM